MVFKQVDYTRQNVYFSPKDGFYYALCLQSEVSSKYIEQLGVLMIGWSRGGFGCNFLIVDESEFPTARESFGSKAYEHYTQVLVIITNDLPIDAVLYDYTQPPRTGGRAVRGLDCFEIADEELATNASEHKHLVSANPRRNIEVGFVDGRELLAKKDKELEQLEFMEGEKHE
jgi:hypothetical protein